MNEKKKMTYHCYMDKVKGGWYGKCLGGTIGCFEGTKEITNLDIMDLLPEKMIANDDLDIQLIWIDVLLNKGVNFTSEHLMQAWIDEYDYNFGEYSTGRRNFSRGLKPPVCGKYSNIFYLRSMGCPIRSEIWGLISPGNPDLAASYAYKDGILDHEGDSVWAEQFLAAMEAAAFFEDDMLKLIDIGMKYIPTDSLVYPCIMTALKCWKKGKTWQETWGELRDNYGNPDCTYAPQNMGITVMALLYGEKDFDKTLTITANAAWDVDCTCSTVAALLGIMKGYEKFDKKWLEYVGDEIATFAKPINDMSSVSLIAEYTCRAGATLIREKMNEEIYLEGIPTNIEYLSTASYADEVSIEVDYCGNPVVSVNETKDIQVYLTNNRSSALEASLCFKKIPDTFEINKVSENIKLGAGQRIGLLFKVLVKKDIQVLADKNIFTLEVKKSNKIIASHDFGICGAPTACVSKLFYDTYMDWLKVEDMPEKRLLRSKGEIVIIPELPEEWGNHRVDIHKEYLGEDFSNRIKTKEKFTGCKKVSIIEDSFILKDAYGFSGSACVYYYQELFSPVERNASIFTGSTDPFKTWLNGNLVQMQDECRFWYPYQHVTKIKLNEGINHIVIKIARKGADNRLSMAFRHEQILTGFDSAANLTDLSFSTFSWIDNQLFP